MPVCIMGAARTPWTPRNGPLASVAPETLLATALEAAVSRSGLELSQIDRVLVACDTGVGAQALNVARRAVVELGWSDVPALTLDGQGAGDLGAVELASRSSGVSLVGAVDATSIVPPGAGLVRDYGRPSREEPELAWLEQLAVEANLDRTELDELSCRLREQVAQARDAIAPVGVGSTTVASDVAPSRPDAAQLDPVAGPNGVVTAFHHATLADGAAAVVVGAIPGATCAGRVVERVSFTAGAPELLIERLAQADSAGVTVLADPSAVIHKLVDHRSAKSVSSVLATGSAPSADGLRALVDAFFCIEEACAVVRRGSGGLVAHITLSPASAPSSGRRG